MRSHAEHYHAGFYRGQSGSSFEAGRSILPAVFEVVRPRSVVDVGCGVGSWLAAAREAGAERAVGLDGDWVSAGDMMDDEIDFRPHDLEKPFDMGERFDLAMSLEVAEHLTPERAESFVDDICRLSDVILFGAAIPGQGGVNHLNERWQSFWAGLFAARGYRALDVVRPRFWEDASIPVHYRQNTLLYVNDASEGRVLEALGPDFEVTPWNLDLVHPEVFLNNYEEMLAPPTLPQALGITLRLPLFVWRSIQARMPGRQGA